MKRREVVCFHRPLQTYKCAGRVQEWRRGGPDSTTLGLSQQRVQMDALWKPPWAFFFPTGTLIPPTPPTLPQQPRLDVPAPL